MCSCTHMEESGGAVEHSKLKARKMILIRRGLKGLEKGVARR